MRVIETTVPLSMEAIKEFYADKEGTVFKIEYGSSKLENDAFVNYCANLEVRATLSDAKDLDFDTKSNLLKAFMENSVVSELKDLAFEAAHIVLYLQGSEYQLLPTDTQLFTNEERSKFISSNISIVKNWMIFFNSLMLFVFDIIERTSERVLEGGEKTSVEENAHSIVDAHFVGKSVVTVMCLHSFLEAFFSVKPHQEYMYYLEVQFKENCFKKKTLYEYFAVDGNAVLISALYKVFKNDDRFS